MERGDRYSEHEISRRQIDSVDESDISEGAQEHIEQKINLEKIDKLFTEQSTVEQEQEAKLRPGEVTQYNFRQLIIHMFGDTPDTIRMVQKWGERGLKGTDAWIYGLVTVDRNGEKRWTKTGPEVSRWQDDEAAKKSAEWNSKTNGREHVRNQRRQNFFVERADPNGKVNFRELSAVGKWNLKINIDRLLQVKAEHYQGELAGTFAQNLDLLVEWSAQAKNTLKLVQEGKVPSEEIELNQPEISRLDAFIGKISAMILGLDEQKGVNIQALTDKIMDDEHISEAEATEKARQQYNELVHSAITQSQDAAFWELQKEIQENRIAAGWDDDNDWDELDADAINSAKKTPNGSTQFTNPRLAPLHTQTVDANTDEQKHQNESTAHREINLRGTLSDLENNLTILTKELSSALRAESRPEELQKLQQSITELQSVIEIRKWAEHVERQASHSSMEILLDKLKPEAVKQLTEIHQELSAISDAILKKDYKSPALIGDRLNAQYGSIERLIHELPEKLRDQLEITSDKIQQLRYHDTANEQANEIKLLHAESIRKIMGQLINTKD